MYVNITKVGQGHLRLVLVQCLYRDHQAVKYEVSLWRADSVVVPEM